MRCVIKKWGFGGTAPEKSLRTLDPLTLSLSRRERERVRAQKEINVFALCYTTALPQCVVTLRA